MTCYAHNNNERQGKATACANGGWAGKERNWERGLLALGPSCMRMTMLTLEEHSLALSTPSKKVAGIRVESHLVASEGNYVA